MPRTILPLLAAIWLAVPFAHAESGRLSDACVSTIGVETASSFPAFDAELRAALANSDPVAMALLIKYPLHIKAAGGGSYSITSGEYLRLHFQEVFTPELRNAVDEQPISSLVCKRDQGVMYGHGELWAAPTDAGWIIKSLNLDPSPATAKPAASAVVYVCRTRKHRILIDVDGDSAYRYRAWNTGHSILGPADVEVGGGKPTSEGASICAVHGWKFRSGAVTYTVLGGLGCYEESQDQPPSGATGDLSITVNGKIDTQAWCY